MNSFCSYFNSNICSSCSKIQSPYAEQITIKEKELIRLLSALSPVSLLPTLTSKELGFRNKAKMIVSGALDNPIIGLDQKEILSCPIHHPKINELIIYLKDFIKLAGLHPYQISEKKGELKAFILFYSESSHEAYLRIILRSKESLDRIKKHHSYLLDKFTELKSISINIQPKHMAVLEGEEELFITEETSIHNKIGPYSFTLDPRGFVQTNQIVAEKLYETAAMWVKELNVSSFLELYCGQGAFSFFCSPYVNSAIGIEINSHAVMEANRLAASLQKPHLQFIAANAENISNEIQHFKAEVILVNPPRSGLKKSVELIKSSHPKYLIYSSCNPETLATDLENLKDIYQIKKCQIFDMFPHTTHFEVLVLLEAIPKT